MIYDHIKSIGLYKDLTSTIVLALDKVASVIPDAEVCTHPLDIVIKAIVASMIGGQRTNRGMRPICGISTYRLRSSVRKWCVASHLRRLPRPSPYNEARILHSMPTARTSIWSLAMAFFSVSFWRMPTIRGWRPAGYADR